MNNRQRFEEAYDAFVPAPDDNPDNVWFYRTYAGLKAAWGPAFHKNYEAVLHHVACTARELRSVPLYDGALRQLAFYLEHGYEFQIPEEPHYRGFYDQMPQYPGERDAKELFNSEFKRVYPDKRLNSREAHEKWAANKDKAFQILVDQYHKKMAHYTARENECAEQNRLRRAEWLDKIHARALFEIEVEKILKEAADEKVPAVGGL